MNNDILWKYLGNRFLQNELEGLYPSLMERLEKLIPAVSGEDFDPAKLYTKKQLIKIFNAFLDGKMIRNRSFLNRCLEYIPEDVLSNLNIEMGSSQKEAVFAEKKSAIIRKVTNSIDGFKTFIQFFNLPDHYLPTSAKRLEDRVAFEPPSYQDPTKVHSAYKVLKDYQSGVFFECINRLQIPRSRFIVQMPTGSGKTRTGMELITSLINESQEDVIVVWLAHSEELCEQAFRCFCDTWEHVGQKRLIAYRSWSDHGFPFQPDDCSKFVVAGFQKLASLVGKNPDAFNDIKSKIKLVVVDEAHRTTAPTFKRVTESLIGKNTHVVGLSATPGRGVMEETEKLSDFYFSTQVGLPVSGDMGVIQMLREKKVLSKVEYQEIRTNQIFELTPNEKRRLENELDFPAGFLQRVGNDDIRNIEILKRLRTECENKHQILFFGCDIGHSKFITALLVYFGYKAGHVDCNTDKATRRKLTEDFRTGDLQVLCNVGILSTGFDAPNTDVVFISRPTQSVVLYSQMIGRGLRGPAIGGTASCRVIDVKDNIDGFGDADQVYEYFDEYFHN